MAGLKNYTAQEFEAEKNKNKLALLETITDEYPKMSGLEFEWLKDDIKKNGVLQPLLAVKRGNQVLIYDRRNRYNAIIGLLSSATRRLFGPFRY